MAFNLVSKNNVGVVLTLLLIIALSQSKFFNFLLDNALGRAILIVIILALSYINKIFGVIAVMFIIIMFNSSDIGYLEGLEGLDPSGNNVEQNKEARILEREKIRQTVKANLDAKQNAEASTSSIMPSSVVPTSVMPSSTTTTTTSVAPVSSTSAPVTATPSTTPATEGFDIIGTENHIKRGKQSNSIPVNESMRSSYSVVSPFDGYNSTDYASF
jgi:hypothetical protein